ncbi:MAG: pur operon repressor, partial [Synergistaceae bacterium]|nr:pur operon repressor [Synergistaceae bacterium]
MRGKRTQRLIRVASRMLLHPSRQMSLTETAAGFGVSKTLVSDDIEIISEALKSEGVGSIVTDRGRSGGAYFIPSPSKEFRLEKLRELAAMLSVPERMLPGELVYYTDLLFDPDWASFLGFAMA